MCPPEPLARVLQADYRWHRLKTFEKNIQFEFVWHFLGFNGTRRR
jgi:hypothetical protein